MVTPGGGAALSIKAISGKPILYVGMGEKLSDLEQFYPDRMASRILGMGDVMSLIEKAQQSIDEDKAREMEQKIKKATFGFDDYLESMNQMKNMGGISSVLNMLPGLGNKAKDIEGMIDEKDMAEKRSYHPFDDSKGESQPGSFEPVQKETNRPGRRCRYRRSQSDGQTV